MVIIYQYRILLMFVYAYIYNAYGALNAKSAKNILISQIIIIFYILFVKKQKNVYFRKIKP